MEKSSNISQGAVSGAADSVLVKLKYGFHIDNDFGVSSAFNHVFSLNSAYDPDSTGVGGTPNGFSEWAAFYSRYRVYRTKVRVEAAAQGIPLLVALWPRTINSGVDAPEDVVANPRALWRIIGNNAPVARIENTYELKDLFGLTHTQYQDEDYSGTTGTSPAQQFYVYFHASTASQTTSSGFQVLGYLEMEFTVQFYDRKDIDIGFLVKEKELVDKFLEENGSSWGQAVAKELKSNPSKDKSVPALPTLNRSFK